jgi:hypothetical protein
MKTVVDLTSNTIASLNDFFDDFPNPLIVVHFIEEQRQIVYINQAFIHEIGYSTAEIPNIEAWYQLAYPNEDVRAVMELDMLKNCYCHGGEETQSWQIKRKITCKSGIEKWYTIKITLGKRDLKSSISPISMSWSAKIRSSKNSIDSKTNFFP